MLNYGEYSVGIKPTSSNGYGGKTRTSKIRGSKPRASTFRPHHIMEQTEGIEPSPLVWKTRILTVKLRMQMGAVVGIEPTIFRL